ncbi:MAG: DEAD/DEAH box helicase [Anaerolineales bacterium]|nr:MAG: DEAD/DEAH box helicase [Anaerolineales bacterium]
MANLEALLAHWRAEPGVGGNITRWHQQPARPGQYEPLPSELHPALAAAFARLGYGQLYSHQAAAWRGLRAGTDVAVVTGTASGKTLCYNLPVLDSLLRDEAARALYLFPTKALAHDQRDELDAWLAAASAKLPVAAYDGDTPTHHRTNIRRKAHLIISNPDMLHYSILPSHTQWAEFFGNLKHIVIDEMHYYRGVFGSHVANVLRRLARVTRFYGAQPQFVLASATIANPGELAERLIERQVTLIEEDGAPRGPRHFVVYNPPVVDEQLGLRASLYQESVRLASDLLAYDVQTILFGRTRRMVEVMLKNLRDRTAANEAQIRGYRGGYLAAERREIETGLRSGQLRAVVATNALELGVDIGGMGAAVLAGYPGSVAATWQQAGRSGRGEQPALGVLVASANPLDQYLARHPEYLLGRSPERALINPDNLLILLSHLRCAAFELPFQPGENFGTVPAAEVEEFLRLLAEGGELRASGGKYYWMQEQQPARGVNLRGASTDSVVIQARDDKGAWQLVGEVDPNGALWLAHPDAIYIHDGRTYFVDKLDLDEKVAYLRPIEADYYTVPKSRSTVSLVEEHKQQPAPGGSQHYGELNITVEITGYDKIQWSGNGLADPENPGGGQLSLPPIELNTYGYWFAIGDDTVERLREQGLWTNDANDYGPDWMAVRKAALERDGHRCQVCGAPEPLDVHHKQPLRSFRSHEEGNRLENLVSLCPTCHRRAEAVVAMRSGLAGLSFVLRHLAPLYLMCDPSDLGVHSDPRSDLAEGGPVVVMYDNVGNALGFSERLFDLHGELMAAALELVENCGCKDGCPSCVGPGGEQGQGSKRETLALLRELVAERSEVNHVPANS